MQQNRLVPPQSSPPYPHGTPSKGAASPRPAAGRALVAATALALAALACSFPGADAPVPVLLLLRAAPGPSTADPHAALLEQDPYPSASACRACHPEHYREWSVSTHAYAQISPTFNAMNGTLLRQSSGTLGDFCIRCHTPVGMALGEPLFAANADRAPVSREGVTCVACHRVDQAYGKNFARGHIRPGGLEAPVYGPLDGDELERVLGDPETFGPVSPEEGHAGRRIHAEARFWEPISTPSVCATCHEIYLTGFREDETLSEYKQSPASGAGQSCQDCHMGQTPGQASGYRVEPAAHIGDAPTAPRKHTDHMFPGPDVSLVHPAIFPHDPALAELASVEEWLQFDWRAGWGTDAFEDQVTDDRSFPERWAWAEDRYDAREALEGSLALLEEARRKGDELLRNGYGLSEIRMLRADRAGLAFEVDVQNVTTGHNVPVGFLGERITFLQATVTDADGNVLFASGDLDPNGDLRDRHSLYVRNGELPVDDQLFSLQSRFVTRLAFGGEKEQILPTNTSLDPLPFVRPDTRPTTLLGRKTTVRFHKRSIEPGGSRRARYEVDAGLLTGHAPYRVQVRLVAGMLPVHLVNEIRGVGFDYGLSPRDVADGLVRAQRVLWERETMVDLE